MKGFETLAARPGELWSVADVAALLGVSGKTVVRYTQTEGLRAITIRGRRWFLPDDVRSWLAARAEVRTAPAPAPDDAPAGKGKGRDKAAPLPCWDGVRRSGKKGAKAK